MAEYRQNTGYDTIIDDSGEEEVEEKQSHGNTGLPFGLCKKYGISLPQSATPRQAWDALKGIGVYPPWTKEGEGQYEGDDAIADDTNDIKDDNVKISPTRKETYKRVEERLKAGKFSPEFQDQLNSILMNLTDTELEVFALMDKVRFYSKGKKSRAGLCQGGDTIMCGEYPDPVDTELGYSGGMYVFGHEYGHAVDWQYGEAQGGAFGGGVSQQEDCKQAYQEDVLNYFNRACEEAGVPTLKNMSRITREQREAIWSKMHRDSWRDKSDFKPMSDFVREAPREPWYSRIETDSELLADTLRYLAGRYINDEETVKRIYEEKKAYRDEAQKRNAEAKADYEKKLREYEEYKNSEEYKRGLALYEEYEANRKANDQKYKVRLQRFGTISDFIGEITEGKFDVKNRGYYSHTVSYYKQRGFQKGAETWATFFGMKMTRDTAGLEMMKSLLPKTYEAYSRHYSQIAKVLSGRGGTKKKN